MAEIETKEVKPMTVMSRAFTGSYQQTGDVLDEMIAWVLRVGHPYAGPPMGIYYDNPEEVAEEELRAEVAVPIDEECEGGEKVVRKQLPGCLVAWAVHQGPYDQVKQVYGEIFAWIAENGYRCPEGVGAREIFLKGPGEVESPEEFLTEVQVPIETV